MIRKKMAAIVMVAAMFFGITAVTPQLASAQTSTGDPEIAAMVAQIQQLMAILVQLQAQVESMRSQDSAPSYSTVQEYEWTQFGRSVRAGDTLAVAQLAAPDTGDTYRYLDYLSIAFIPDDGSKPWETFESVSMGLPTRELTFDMSRPDVWKQSFFVDYGWGYSMVIFDSQSRGYGIRLPGDYQEAHLKLNVQDDAEAESWDMLIPVGAAKVWSESTGYTVFGGVDYDATFSISEPATDNTTSSNNQSDSDFWSVDSYRNIVGVGTYEGTNSSDTTVSGGNRPGTVEVEIPAGSLYEDTMLVLTAYEPVTWNIVGDGADEVSRVFLSGYYDQDVIGLDRSVEVLEQTYKGGSRDYFYFYQTDDNYDELIDYIDDQSGVRPYNFEYGYKLEEATLSWKG